MCNQYIEWMSVHLSDLLMLINNNTFTPTSFHNNFFFPKPYLNMKLPMMKIRQKPLALTLFLFYFRDSN